MRMTVIPALAIAAALSGCAAPVALQVASFAADGIAFVSTGKGTADHALSALAGENCRLSNVFRGRVICAPSKAPASDDASGLASAPATPVTEAEIAALAGLAPEADPVRRRSGIASAFAAPAMKADIAAFARVAPAAGSMLRLSLVESAGMNVAEVSGAPAGSSVTGRVDGGGTLHVHLVTPDGSAAASALFTVPGYGRNPGAFTGVVIGTRFIAPDSFLR